MRLKTVRKLGHHQYSLKFPRWHDWEVPPRQRKQGYLGGPYTVFADGQWHVYRSRWKSQFRGPRLWAAALSAPTLSELRARIIKSRDGRYGYQPGMTHANQARRS